MKSFKNAPRDLRAFECPQCEKYRLHKPLDYTPNREEKEFTKRDGTPIKLFVDICDFCKKKNWHKFFEPTKADIRKVIKALAEEKQLDQSLEEML